MTLQRILMTRRKKYYTHIYTSYTNDMRMYLRKDAETTNGDLTTTFCSVKNMTHNTEGVEDQIFMDNFFFTYKFYDLETSKISATMTI